MSGPRDNLYAVLKNKYGLREKIILSEKVQSETRDQVINEKGGINEVTRHYNKGRFSEMKTAAEVLSLQGVYGGNSYGQ